MTKKKTKKEPKQYFEKVPRRLVYGLLIAFAVVALLLFLCVPHYKPLQLATPQQTQDAHRDIIRRYFLVSTICRDDNREKADRIKTFNKYFQTNKYANRAVIRGCNDIDSMLYKDDQGKWQRSDVNIILDFKHNPKWQKACLIDDITVAATKVKPENSSIDSANLGICETLAKESYIEVNFKLGIHFHF
jgi:hypothetical protein